MAKRRTANGVGQYGSEFRSWKQQILEVLLPEGGAEKIGDMNETGFRGVTGVLLRDIGQRIRQGFDLFVILGGIAGLALPFGVFYDTPIIPLTALVTIGAITMRCRDGWVHPAKGTAPEALMDALVVAVSLVGSEALFAFAAPALLVPTGSFIPGLAAGVLIASICRLTAHRNQSTNLARKNQALRPFWRAAVIIALWFGACILLQYVNVEYAVPGSDERNFFMMPLTLLCLPIALKLQGNSLTSLWWNSPVREKQLADPLPADIKKKEDLLDWSGNDRKAQLLQVLFFVLLALPHAEAVWDKLSGTRVIIDWRQVFINFSALLALLAMWGEIKDIGTQAAKQLRENRAVAVLNSNALPNTNV